ncbi:YhdP family protein [Thermosulfuriphilus sp.]
MKILNRWLLATAALIVGLVLALALVLPHLIDLKPIRGRISQELSTRLKTQVAIGSLKIQILPRPQAKIASLILESGRFKADIQSLSIRLSLWGLFKRELLFESIKLESPRVEIFLQESQRKSPWQRELAGILATSAFLEVKDGQVAIWRGKKRLAQLKSISGALRTGQGQGLLEAQMQGSFFERAEASLRINESGGLDGRVEVSNLKLHLLPVSPPQKIPFQPKEAELNLRLTLNLESLKSFEVGFSGSIPCYRLPQREYAIRCGHFEGWATRKENLFRLRIISLKLDYPRLLGEGEFWYQPGREVGYRFSGQDIDVSTLRTVALDLLGSYRSVKRLFEIVRGGMATELEISERAPDLQTLKDISRIKLQTSFKEAQVILPHSGLKIEKGQGELNLREAILRADGLSAQIGRSRVLEAKVEIALKDSRGPLNLELQGICQLEEVHDIVHRFVKKGPLRHHLDLFYRSQGQAYVSLSLRGTRKKVIPVFEARKIKARVRHRRLPYPIRVDQGSFGYREGIIWWEGVSGALGKSVVEESSGRLRLKGLLIRANLSSKVFLPELDAWVQKEPLFKPLAQRIRFPEGQARIKTSIRGPLKDPDRLKFELSGTLEQTRINIAKLPADLHVEEGLFNFSPQRLVIKKARGQFLESDLQVKGILLEPLKGIKELRLSGKGVLRGPLAAWIFKLSKAPKEIFPRTPLSIRDFSLVSNLNDKTELHLLAARKRVILDLRLLSDPKVFEILRLCLSSPQKEIELSFRLNRGEPFFELRLSGQADGELLETFLEKNQILNGTIFGDLKARINLSEPGQSIIEGEIHLNRLRRLLGLKVPLRLDHLALEASGSRITIKDLVAATPENRFQASGWLEIREGIFWFDFDFLTPKFDWPAFKRRFLSSPGQRRKLPVAGRISFATPQFIYHSDRVFDDVSGTLEFMEGQEILIQLKKATYCGVLLSGKIKILPSKMADLAFDLSAHQADLEKLAFCLAGEQHLFEGRFDLSGHLEARGKENPLAEESQGNFQFSASEGRIYRLSLLSKLFTLLNPLEIFRGGLPDLVKEGFAYEKIDGQAELKDGILKINYLAIDGRPMKIFAEGKINLLTSQADLEILVAPLKTIDSIVSKIPILGFVLTGKKKVLISIPVKVEGPLNDPNVWPLPPTSIGSGILGVVKRAFKLPTLILKPLEGQETAPRETP